VPLLADRHTCASVHALDSVAIEAAALDWTSITSPSLPIDYFDETNTCKTIVVRGDTGG